MNILLSAIPEGVNILSQTEILKPIISELAFGTIFLTSIMFFFIFLLLLFCSIDNVKSAKKMLQNDRGILNVTEKENLSKQISKNSNYAWIFGIIAVFFIFLCVLNSILMSINKPTGRYEYKATISDEASFNEVISRFDIIEQDGDLYILQDKKTEE